MCTGVAYGRLVWCLECFWDATEPLLTCVAVSDVVYAPRAPPAMGDHKCRVIAYTYSIQHCHIVYESLHLPKRTPAALREDEIA